MRLLTLNIRYGAGSESLDKPGYNVRVTESKISALASAIHCVNPDIVALQEVKTASQAKRIASKLKMTHLYCRHPSSYAMDFFEWGLALMYRLDATGHGNVTVYFDEYTRSGRQMLVGGFSDQSLPFTIFNVHLDPRDIDRQIENVCAEAEKIDCPVILAGDFNCAPDDSALEPIKRKYLDACRAVTTPGAAEAESIGTVLNGSERIDYIFIDPEHWIVRDAGLLPETHRRVSDHIGFFAVIEWKGLAQKNDEPKPLGNH